MTAGARRFTVLLALALVAGVASARPDVPWDGVYFGANFGEASSSSCNTWSLNDAAFDPATASEFNNRVCPGGDAFVGGLQVGENFQYKRLVWGIGADIDYWSAKNFSQSLKYPGLAAPAGTYTYSSAQNPREFAVIGPRIGYGGDMWFPYLKVGAIVTAGSHDSALAYTPAGAAKPTASFAGGKDFSTAGWAAGGGFELGLNGAWSITVEYLHASLGKGSNSTATCGGLAPACAAFSGISFDDSHEGFSTNIFRVGVTYWFGYW